MDPNKRNEFNNIFPFGNNKNENGNFPNFMNQQQQNTQNQSFMGNIPFQNANTPLQPNPFTNTQSSGIGGQTSSNPFLSSTTQSAFNMNVDKTPPNLFSSNLSSTGNNKDLFNTGRSGIDNSFNYSNQSFIPFAQNNNSVLNNSTLTSTNPQNSFNNNSNLSTNAQNTSIFGTANNSFLKTPPTQNLPFGSATQQPSASNHFSTSAQTPNTNSFVNTGLFGNNTQQKNEGPLFSGGLQSSTTSNTFNTGMQTTTNNPFGSLTQSTTSNPFISGTQTTTNHPFGSLAQSTTSNNFGAPIQTSTTSLFPTQSNLSSGTTPNFNQSSSLFTQDPSKLGGGPFSMDTKTDTNILNPMSNNTNQSSLFGMNTQQSAYNPQTSSAFNTLSSTSQFPSQNTNLPGSSITNQTSTLSANPSGFGNQASASINNFPSSAAQQPLNSTGQFNLPSSMPAFDNKNIYTTPLNPQSSKLSDFASGFNNTSNINTGTKTNEANDLNNNFGMKLNETNAQSQFNFNNEIKKDTLIPPSSGFKIDSSADKTSTGNTFFNNKMDSTLSNTKQENITFIQNTPINFLNKTVHEIIKEQQKKLEDNIAKFQKVALKVYKADEKTIQLRNSYNAILKKLEQEEKTLDDIEENINFYEQILNEYKPEKDRDGELGYVVREVERLVDDYNNMISRNKCSDEQILSLINENMDIIKRIDEEMCEIEQSN